jgi:hypothetical protein
MIATMKSIILSGLLILVFALQAMDSKGQMDTNERICFKIYNLYEFFKRTIGDLEWYRGE